MDRLSDRLSKVRKSHNQNIELIYCSESDICHFLHQQLNLQLRKILDKADIASLAAELSLSLILVYKAI